MNIEVKEYESLTQFYAAIATDIISRKKKLVYRGMSDANWDLVSSLYRFQKELGEQVEEIGGNERIVKNTSLLEQLLFDTFKKNIIVNNDVKADLIEKMSTEDVLQLGQHFGLPSPLLDWTRSPYVSLYFAIKDRLSTGPEKRAVWSLNLDVLKFINHHIETELWNKNESYKRDYPKYRLIETRPIGVNQRVEFQQGHFTRERNAEPIADWAQRVSKKITFPRDHLLTKYQWPENERERLETIDLLNLMNINGRVLFPDIEGSVNDAKAVAANSLLSRDGFTMSFSLKPKAPNGAALK